jgi:hypothetical protein
MLENTEGAIKNGQSRETGNIGQINVREYRRGNKKWTIKRNNTRRRKTKHLFALCCQFLWIVHFLLPLQYSLTFICLMLPVSLDCPFFIAALVFSNMYLHYVASFSGLSIFDWPFGIL